MENFTEPELNYAAKMLLEMQKWEEGKIEGLRKLLEGKGIDFSLDNLPEILKVTSYTSLREEMFEGLGMEFCKDRKCHDVDIPGFSCFFCNCINYDSSYLKFDFENERIIVGKCKPGRKTGKYYFGNEFPRVGVWDCSDCTITHTMNGVEGKIRKHFEELRARFDRD